MTLKKSQTVENQEQDQDRETAEQAETAGHRIALSATIQAGPGRALDPQKHDAQEARDIAVALCNALTTSFSNNEKTRPETLAVAVQTVLETLISSIEREGVDAASMRIALANSMLVNGEAQVKIDIDGKRVPSSIAELSKAIH
ncbi:MAG: hypothetical protein AAGM38_14810 [Pseudomonadota bacterium]